MGELGLMGLFIPEECGGSGGDIVSYALAVEELARVCASHAVIMSVNNSLYCEPVYKFGTPEQKQRFLAPYASGEKLGCFSLTEPEAGSDATNQNVLARRDGDDYVIQGRKVFVTNGREARRRPRLRPDRPDQEEPRASAPFSSKRGPPASPW